METYTLDQASKLYESGVLASGHEESAENEPLFPPLSRAALCGNVPRAPRQYWRDDEEGDTSPDIDGEESEESAPRYASHILPSMRDRASVRQELREMGMAWAD